MKIYIAGKITNNPEYKKQFEEAEKILKKQGHTKMNPAVLPDGFEYRDYMRICFSMIDACEGLYFLNNWQDSPGAKMEHLYAQINKKSLIFQEAS